MGVCQSSEVQVQMQISKKIDRELRVTPEKLTQKLLLLGPGESGKSTILKQMQILHSNGFTDMEIEERRNIVYSNTITSMIAILEAMEPLGITFESSEREKDARIVRAVVEEGNELLPFTSETKKALKQLWADRGIRQCFDQRSVYQLNDS
uniref:Uncharacterized protein n=1 Tax=Plectus sambesii TaxID=2011161 RepID=A0A914VYW6_9BILA